LGPRQDTQMISLRLCREVSTEDGQYRDAVATGYAGWTHLQRMEIRLRYRIANCRPKSARSVRITFRYGGQSHYVAPRFAMPGPVRPANLRRLIQAGFARINVVDVSLAPMYMPLR